MPSIREERRILKNKGWIEEIDIFMALTFDDIEVDYIKMTLISFNASKYCLNENVRFKLYISCFIYVLFIELALCLFDQF